MTKKTSEIITGIDTHAHVFSKDLPLTAERRYAPEYDALPSSYLEYLDRYEISHGVLVQPSFLGTDNQYMTEAISKHPERLRGIAVVDINISDAELDELDDQGIVGIRLNLIKKAIENYTDTNWKRFLAKIEKRGWSVEIHREIEDLQFILPPILESGVDIIVDHFGRPNSDINVDDKSHKAFLDLLQHAPIWTKVSASYRNNAQNKEDLTTQAQIMTDILRSAYGHSDRLLWGSDWPHTQFEKQISYHSQFEIMQSIFTDPTEKQKVLINNPANCFKLS